MLCVSALETRLNNLYSMRETERERAEYYSDRAAYIVWDIKSAIVTTLLTLCERSKYNSDHAAYTGWEIKVLQQPFSLLSDEVEQC